MVPVSVVPSVVPVEGSSAEALSALSLTARTVESMAAMAVSPFAATMEAVSATVCESLATEAAAILAFDARLLRSDWVAVAESAEDRALSMALFASMAFV